MNKGISKMSLDNIKNLLEKYSTACGVSGNENTISEMLEEDIKPYVDEINKDTLGNLIAKKKCSKKISNKKYKRIMLAAHIDEIGLMIKHIDENGFLKFVKIGGWFDQTLLNQRVIVHGKKSNLIGVIGSKPPHVMTLEDLKTPIKQKDMFIDIGANNLTDAKELGVEIGSYVTIDRDFKELKNNKVTCKAFDNRVGIVILLEIMKKLANKKNIDIDIYAVGTVQEEVGLKGAKTSAQQINPDIAIAIDTTIPGDHPGITKEDSILEIGKGPVITVVDASGRGIITHPAVLSELKETAEIKKIPYQLDVGAGGTTDATAIHLTNNGVPTGVVSIATRYIHSPVEVLDLKDIDNCVNLIVEFIEKIVKE